RRPLAAPAGRAGRDGDLTGALPDLAAAGPAAGRRLVEEGEPRSEQELGVGIRCPVRLGEAVGQPQRGDAPGRLVHLPEYLAGPVGEPDHDVHDSRVPPTPAPRPVAV